LVNQNENSGTGDRLRISKHWQNYRYAKISQHFYGVKNLDKLALSGTGEKAAGPLLTLHWMPIPIPSFSS
jgi:hypothetical protein